MIIRPNYLIQQDGSFVAWCESFIDAKRFAKSLNIGAGKIEIFYYQQTKIDNWEKIDTSHPINLGNCNVQN